MPLSLLKIEFIDAVTSASTLLLDYGDRVPELFGFPMEQRDNSYTAINGLWQTGRAMGGATRNITYSRHSIHSTHQAAAKFSQEHPDSMPILKTGKIRVSIQDGDVNDYLDARVLSCVSTPLMGRRPTTVTAYRIVTGKRVNVSTSTPTPVAPTPGNPGALVEADPFSPGDAGDLIPGDSPQKGIVISGITEPALMNGFIPAAASTLYPGKYYFRIASESIAVECFYTDAGWLLQSAAEPFDPENGYWTGESTAANPWDVETWTPQIGDGPDGRMPVGAPVIHPIGLPAPFPGDPGQLNPPVVPSPGDPGNLNP